MRSVPLRLSPGAWFSRRIRIAIPAPSRNRRSADISALKNSRDTAAEFMACAFTNASTVGSPGRASDSIN